MPSLDQCDELIQKALAAKSCEEFGRFVTPLAKCTGVLAFAIGRGQAVWRARKLEGKPPFELLEDLDYKKPDKVTTPGRLHDVGEACFYAANSISTALSEVHAQEGELVQVAGFRVDHGKYLEFIAVGEYFNVHARGYTMFNGTDPGGTIRKLLSDLPPDLRQRQLMIDRFFYDLLSDNDARDSGYMRTRALKHLLYAKSPGASAIGYGSVREPGGYNWAVKADDSDDLFVNVACVVVRQGKRRSYPPHDHEIIGSATGLLRRPDRFVWDKQPVPGNLHMYNVTMEEMAGKM